MDLEDVAAAAGAAHAAHAPGGGVHEPHEDRQRSNGDEGRDLRGSGVPAAVSPKTDDSEIMRLKRCRSM